MSPADGSGVGEGEPAVVALARLERRAARDRAARLEAEGIAETQLRRTYERAREVELLADIAVIVNESHDLSAALGAAARTVRRHCGYAVSHVLVRDDSGAFVTSDIWDADPAHLDFLDRVIAATADESFVPPEGLPGEVAASHLAIWLPDLAAAAGFRRKGNLLSGSAWAFPVVTGVTVTAVIEFIDPAPRGADERLLQLAPSLGSQLGRAVDWDRVRAREAADRRRLEELVAAQSEALQSTQQGVMAAEQARSAYVGHLVHDVSDGLARLREVLADPRPAAAESTAQRLTALEETARRLLVAVEGSQRRTAGERVRVSPADLVRGVASRYDIAGGPTVQVGVRPGADLDLELVAPLVERALGSILENAVLHAGGDRVDVEVDVAGGKLVLRVLDQGPGFTWEQNGIRPQGTGGLAQAARLAVALGGSLTVSARPEGGTVAELRVASGAGSAPASSQGRGGRILVVDDNQINRRLAAAMLARIGLEADVVESAEQALESMSSTSYGLVLMDIQMPEMDGREATRMWRASAGGSTSREVPIVALTAHVGQEERDACTAAGMDAYLSKPFGIEALADVCRYWLAAAQDGDPEVR